METFHIKPDQNSDWGKMDCVLEDLNSGLKALTLKEQNSENPKFDKVKVVEKSDQMIKIIKTKSDINLVKVDLDTGSEYCSNVLTKPILTDKCRKGKGSLFGSKSQLFIQNLNGTPFTVQSPKGVRIKGGYRK